jgi:hypothetical protein
MKRAQATIIGTRMRRGGTGGMSAAFLRSLGGHRRLSRAGMICRLPVPVD